jgi:G3E family GTPase
MIPVPVTIVSGFLGSGKTTLINYLLQHNENEPIAVIENEFGEVNIDKALLAQSGNVQIVELGGGCVCCSIRGELTESLKALALQIEKGELCARRFILETTGLADTAPIIQTFFADETLREQYILDGVVTLVDAKHIQKQLDEHKVALSQIGFADRIIVTKTDLVDRISLNDVFNRIHTINNKAEIWQAVNGVIAKDAWININAFEMNDSLSLQEGFYVAEVTSKVASKFVRFGKGKKHLHGDNISSFVLEGKSYDIQSLDSFLEALVAEYGNDMLRYKGILSINNEPHRLIVQGVHKVVGLDYGAPWASDEERKSVMVIIGRNLPKEKIKARFGAMGFRGQ